MLFWSTALNPIYKKQYNVKWEPEAIRINNQMTYSEYYSKNIFKNSLLVFVVFKFKRGFSNSQKMFSIYFIGF